MIDIRILGEIAARTPMLAVVCSRCERRGRYRLDALIGRHGAAARVRIIVPALTTNCPRRDSPTLMERCDVLFPDLVALDGERRA